MHVPRFEVEMSDLIESLVFARVTKMLAMVLLCKYCPPGACSASRVSAVRGRA